MVNLLTRCLLLQVLFGAGSADAQVESSQPAPPETPRPFEVDAISFSSPNPGMSRLDIFVRISYEQLSFVQVDEDYLSAFEVSVDLLDSTGKSYADKSWTEEISTGSFDESVSSEAYSLVQQILEAAPGSYSLLTTVRDLETRTAFRSTRPVTLRDFTSEVFSLSGIMLLSRISSEGGRKRIVPNVSSNVGELENGFHAFLEAYNHGSLESIATITEILDEEQNQLFAQEARHSLLEGRNQVFVRVPNNELSMGNYLLRIRAFDGEKELASTARPFLIRWSGIPLAAKDLEFAIQQLQYIENPGEIDHIKEADSEDEKRERFMEFWRERDPTPATPRNEKMEDYYAKVKYANKHFSHYIEGWRTDMGMVYILFGPPNNVERHPFDIDSKPYEIWSYYDLNHDFVFIDATGFGDYHLESPIWEVWERAK